MYTPQPVLGEERRTEVEQKARTLLQSGRLRKRPRHRQSGTATEVRRLASVIGAAPVVAGKWVRWALRGRARFGGMCAMLSLVYERLSHWGVFDYTQDKIERATAVYTDIKEKLVESSEFVSEVVSTLEGFHPAVGSIIEPWRAFAYLVSAAFCYWFMSDTKETHTPGSSPGTSPGSSPGSSPPITPRTDEVSKAMQTMANAFEKQTAMLGMIVENQET